MRVIKVPPTWVALELDYPPTLHPCPVHSIHSTETYRQLALPCRPRLHAFPRILWVAYPANPTHWKAAAPRIFTQCKQRFCAVREFTSHTSSHLRAITHLLLLISMLWHRQAIFESKGDKLSSSAESRIRTQRVSDTYSPADWMPADKPTELSRIKQKLELDSPSLWSASFQPTWPHCHLAFAPGSGDIYIFVVVNFDTLAQASDFRIERRQVVFLCWKQHSNPEGLRHLFASRLNACWQTDWAIEDQAKTWTRQPVPMISKHSAHLTPLPFGIRTWLWRYTYLLLLISMPWHRQAIFESKGDKLSSSAESRIRTQRVSDTYSPADWMPADKPTELSRIKQKLELDSPSLWSASIQPTWPHCHLTFAPGSGQLHSYDKRKVQNAVQYKNAG